MSRRGMKPVNLDATEHQRRIDEGIVRVHRALVCSRTRLIEARRTGDIAPAITSLRRAWTHLDALVRECAALERTEPSE